MPWTWCWQADAGLVNAGNGCELIGKFLKGEVVQCARADQKVDRASSPDPRVAGVGFADVRFPLCTAAAAVSVHIWTVSEATVFKVVVNYDIPAKFDGGGWGGRGD